MHAEFLLLFFLIISNATIGQTAVSGSKQIITSPDDNYRFVFYQLSPGGDNSQLCYKIEYKGIHIIEESERGVDIQNILFESALVVPNDACQIWCDNLKLVNVTRTTIVEKWNPIYA